VSLKAGKARIELPAGTDGDFVWQGKTSPLKPGRNEIAL
jgi:hypothetical protein